MNNIRLWVNKPELSAQKVRWLASSATNGKTGLVLSVLSPQSLVDGVVREMIRRVLRKRAPDTSLDSQPMTPNFEKRINQD